ncbi:putative deoxyribonuclease YcfH [Phycisphaerae bacterium RAS1]|nr:putative deoxyribonuclease YcfH [Phycisphaerae bacterium RAS1]
MLVDTHCHLTSREFADQADAVIARARDAGVRQFVTVATTPDDAEAAAALSHKHADVFIAAGIHPHQAGSADEAQMRRLYELHHGGIDPKRLVAVGETGLDFHYDFSPRASQEGVFRFQLGLACKTRRPVVIHARKAESEVCDILADYPMLRDRVVFHCFSADEAVARRIIDMGLWISFTGVVTFKNSEEIQRVAKWIPADRFMVETDSPFLSPEPLRKARPCEPAFVVHTARFLADLRGESLESLSAATTANARRFFKLPEASS